MDYAYNQRTVDASYTLDMLSRKFAGRGLAAGARKSVAASDARGAGYRADRAVYADREKERRYSPSLGYSSSHPMTLGEFENMYFANSEHARAVYEIGKKNQPAKRNTAGFGARTERYKAEPASNARAHTPVKAEGRVVRTGATERRRAQVTSVVPRENSPAVRRSVKDSNNKVLESLGTISHNFRHLPVAVILVVVACAVSLMFIVGSSVMLSDASNEYVKLQSEIADLAKEENELEVALELKNNLRTIEEIAVNKLGMVNKDLVAKQYVSLGDKDVIENYDTEKTNVGLSTLLSAISGGN